MALANIQQRLGDLPLAVIYGGHREGHVIRTSANLSEDI